MLVTSYIWDVDGLLTYVLQEPLQRRPYTSVLSMDDDSKIWFVVKIMLWIVITTSIFSVVLFLCGASGQSVIFTVALLKSEMKVSVIMG